MTGGEDRADALGRALGEHAAHHDAGANLDAVKSAQQPLEAAHEAIGAPRQRVGVEGAGRKRVAHRADAGGHAVRPALVGHVEDQRDVPAAGPAKAAIEARNPRAPRHHVGAAFHPPHPSRDCDKPAPGRDYIRSFKSLVIAGFSTARDGRGRANSGIDTFCSRSVFTK